MEAVLMEILAMILISIALCAIIAIDLALVAGTSLYGALIFFGDNNRWWQRPTAILICGVCGYCAYRTTEFLVHIIELVKDFG